MAVLPTPGLPLEISFLPHDSLIPKATFDRALRISRYGRDSVPLSKDLRELGANLAVPNLGDFGVELWTIPAHSTSAKTVESGNESIELLVTSSPAYTHIRFVCHEKNSLKRRGKQVARSSRELRDLTFSAYSRMFELIRDKTLPGNLVRMWNFIPDILIHDDTISSNLNSERYRQFNAGRQEAWWQHSGLAIDEAKNLWRVPAATGIGSIDGPLIIEAVLTGGQVIDINNPRQTPAYRYGPLYGQNSPMFSRATAHVVQKNYGLLFISGTASVVGEHTLHQDNIQQQVHETFKNLHALMAVSNLKKFLPFTPKRLNWTDFKGMRVHIKHRQHYPLVREIVETYLSDKAAVCYVCDDICRSDFLVEIEANAIELVAAV
jgi:enamine deaminase RidA (YjgF/YER057c/UK114 family)